MSQMTLPSFWVHSNNTMTLRTDVKLWHVKTVDAFPVSQRHSEIEVSDGHRQPVSVEITLGNDDSNIIEVLEIW